jgi:hypothetical protein
LEKNLEFVSLKFGFAKNTLDPILAKMGAESQLVSTMNERTIALIDSC